MTARGASAPFFCSSACCGCDGDGTQDIAPFGAPVGVAVKKWWRGRLPPAAPCGGRGLGWRAPPPALLDSPASPPPTAGRACAPPCGGRRLALAAAAMIQWGGGAAAARPLWGGAPLSGGCGGALPGVGVGAVVVAAPGAEPFRSASLKAPGAAPPPVPAPLRLRARGGGSAGCGQRGRPPALAGGFTVE